MKSIFAKYGIPVSVYSDNGLQYSANYRATPVANGFSPAELLMRRRLRTLVPTVPCNLHVKVRDPSLLSQREQWTAAYRKLNFDRHHAARSLPLLSTGDEVWLPGRHETGYVADTVHRRSYTVRTTTFRWNGNQLKSLPYENVNTETPKLINITTTNDAAQGRFTKESGCEHTWSSTAYQIRSGHSVNIPKRFTKWFMGYIPCVTYELLRDILRKSMVWFYIVNSKIS